MSQSPGEALYALLPAVHRERDAERGLPLRALIAVLAGEAAKVEADIAGLYDDWFIETCAEWVVPYIGDLLGVHGLQEIGAPGFSRRALVANTLAYRRRKGVAGAIEQLAQDATGWRAVAREMFLTLAGTQHLNHLRPGAMRTPVIRNSAPFDPPQGPFGRTAHMVDVRSIAARRGLHNIPNVAVFLWRLQAYRLTEAELSPGPVANAFFASPANMDTPLFNPPRSDAGAADRTEQRSVPGPLRRRALHDELEASRQAMAAKLPPLHDWFDRAAGAEPFRLELDGRPVPPERIAVCDLSTWRTPPSARDYVVVLPEGPAQTVSMPIDAAIDPELGRVILAPNRAGAAVRFSFSYGFAGDLGAGPYSRVVDIAALMDRPATWTAGVSRRPIVPQDRIFPTMVAAVAAWRAQPPGTVGVIAVLDSGRYVEDLTGPGAITVPAGSRLLIVAAGWPARPAPDAPPGLLIRSAGDIDPDGRRPHLVGDIEATGLPPGENAVAGELLIDGLLIEGGITVLDGALGRLALSHATLMPGTGGVSVGDNEDLELTLSRCIAETITLDLPIRRIGIADSIVDATIGSALEAPGTPAELLDSTFLGPVSAMTIEGSGCIFAAPVTAERRQTGCIRYSYVPQGSSTPRRYRCQPDLALRDVPDAGTAAIHARVRPSLTAETYGAPGYGQLALATAPEITAGGEDGTEMGAFRFLRQPQRMANLKALLPQYLPVGIEAGFFFET